MMAVLKLMASIAGPVLEAIKSAFLYAIIKNHTKAKIENEALSKTAEIQKQQLEIAAKGRVSRIDLISRMRKGKL